MIYNPVSTYRIQFNKEFRLKDAEKIIPYLEKTGIKTVYASPLFKATSGSMHGYDVTDPTQINPEIGTEKEFASLVGKLHKKGIGWVQDIVPNHMAFSTENPWIHDLLQKGEKSRYYKYFDLLSDRPGKGTGNKLMLPFFGKSTADLLKDRELKVVLTPSGFRLRYFETDYPLSDESWPFLLSRTKKNQPADLNKVMEVDSPADSIEKNGRLKELIRKNPEVGKFLEASADFVNERPEQMKALLDLQHYEPVHWRETEERAGYRRFFTINGLICLRIRREQVFNDWHAMLFEWIDKGWVDGLRIDHIDGLYDPGAYLEMLRRQRTTELYIVVEKILEEDEKIPGNWPVQGTTGYDFLGMVNNLLTNETNESFFREYTSEWNPGKVKFKDLSLEKKRFILNHRLKGELDYLAQKAVRLLPEYDDDKGSIGLKKAIGEFLVHCPVYKIYNPPSAFTTADKQLIDRIFKEALQDQKQEKAALADLRELFSIKEQNAQAYTEEVDDLFMRCMQFTGPVMAKGIEDTLFYAYHPFLAHNEVGDSPGYFGIRTDKFHRAMQERLQESPLTMNATSTHDTKRGADARARLNVLSDIPERWVEATRNWRKINQKFKESSQGNEIPSPADEYFIYQSLFAHLPMELSIDDTFIARFREFIVKALREAKVNSSWSEPDQDYEKYTIRFIESILSLDTPFLGALYEIVGDSIPHGIANSLTQLILRNTVPGNPDHFQGSESWNLDFVDPDNRKTVDYSQLSKDLNRMIKMETSDARGLIGKLTEHPGDGKIKQWVNHKTLQLRNKYKTLFEKGAYLPLDVKGKMKEHVIAFCRQYRDDIVLVVLPLNTAGMGLGADWDDTRVILPERIPHQFRDTFSGRRKQIIGEYLVKEAFEDASFSVLEGIPNEPSREAGVLMHVSSLPGDYGLGDFGPGTKDFIDFLQKSGQKYWQVLPLTVVDKRTSYSPYSSASAFAGNHLFIDPYGLVELGLIEPGDTDQMKVKPKKKARFNKALQAKNYYIGKAHEEFQSGNHYQLREAFLRFQEREKHWLHDYALFTCLKDQFNGLPWNAWPEEYRERSEATMNQFSSLYDQEIDLIKFTQFLFSLQWDQLKQYANDRGIDILGDVPIYIDFDSADVWSHPGLFQLDKKGEMTGVAGVPPDYFNQDGQHWGMPLFNWPAMKKDQYAWWIARIRKNLELFDIVRLDHFRGFSAYWQIPAGAETAKEGKWVKGPGNDFFDRVREEFPGLPLVAEDLGMIDDKVYALRDRYKLPGMKVVQFGFGKEAPFAEHHPLNIGWNSIAYTGTHDNNTLLGWFRKEADKSTRARISEYSGKKLKKKNVHLEMIRIAYASNARLVIIPMQDWLGLDERTRMNFPSTVEGNWKWRLPYDAWNDGETSKIMGKFVKTYGRY